MSSTTRLMVLGVIRIFQPVHGYDVRRELLTWHVQDWGNVQPGSIYNALKSLTKEGMLEVVGTKQVGSRPERTTYKLTARGEHEMQELLKQTWWQVQMPIDPLVAAVSLLGFMPREEAISALQARAAQIQGQLKHTEFVIESIDNIETPDHVREMMRLMAARVGAELEWSKALVERLRAGEYHLLGDPKWQPAVSRQPSRASKRVLAGSPKVAKPVRPAKPSKSKPKAARRGTKG